MALLLRYTNWYKRPQTLQIEVNNQWRIKIRIVLGSLAFHYDDYYFWFDQWPSQNWHAADDVTNCKVFTVQSPSTIDKAVILLIFDTAPRCYQNYGYLIERGYTMTLIHFLIVHQLYGTISDSLDYHSENFFETDKSGWWHRKKG